MYIKCNSCSLLIFIVIFNFVVTFVVYVMNKSKPSILNTQIKHRMLS